MDSFDHQELVRKLEKRYEAARNALLASRNEFELLSHTPEKSAARLAWLACEIERLTIERARAGEVLARYEDMVA